MYPNAPLIKRNGEVNAWDNPAFKAAVEATGRKQIILRGIVTEVCEWLSFLPDTFNRDLLIWSLSPPRHNVPRPCSS